MKRALSLRLLQLATAVLATAVASSGYADALVDYDEAIVPRQSLERAKSVPSNPKITDDLYRFATQARSKGSRQQLQEMADLSAHRGAKPLFVLEGENLDQIEVYVYLWDKSETSLAELRKAGMRVDYVSGARNLVQGFVPLSSLEALADLEIVREISRPRYGISTAGDVQTQGDAAQLTNLVRSIEGVDGSGVTVGVVSTGLFQESGGGIATGVCNVATASDDLPPYPGTTGAGDCEPPDVPGSGYYGAIPIFPGLLTEHEVPDVYSFVFQRFRPGFPEGASILEVIHDVAPGASLVYGDGRTDIVLELSRRFIRNFSPDLMVENIIFTDAGRYDGTSFVSLGARDIAINGPLPGVGSIPYLVSVGGMTPATGAAAVTAGRFPLQISDRFNGDPRDSRRKVHSWAKATTTARDEALNFRPTREDPDKPTSAFLPISVTLVWDDYWDDDFPRATIDLDLYLVPTASLDLAQAIATSTSFQNGASANPIEQLTYYPVDDTPLSLIIINKNSLSNAQTLFTLSIESGTVSEPNYLTAGVPVCGSDAMSPVISVGHIDLTKGPLVVGDDAIPGSRPFGNVADSAQAGEFFPLWYEGQVRPSVVSYGSVDTVTSMYPRAITGYYTRSFRGPSAAVAHLGGFVALLRHRFPQMTPSRLYELLRDTSGRAENGDPIAALSTDVTPTATKGYIDAPRYLRPNPYAIYDALISGAVNPYADDSDSRRSSVSIVRSDLTTDWTFGPAEAISDMSLASGRVGTMGLELRATSDRSFGFWESPLLTVQDTLGTAPRKELRTDRIYMVEARVGTDETDPLRVPDFRLRLITGTGEESVTMVVAGLTEEGSNAPSDFGGKVYRLYYRPSTPGVAAQGVRVAIDLVHADQKDNRDATIILRDVTFHELALPLSVIP